MYKKQGSVVGVVAAGASFLVAQTQISAVQNNINNLETEMQAMRLELNVSLHGNSFLISGSSKSLIADDCIASYNH